MADVDKSSKTEPPTEKKLSEAKVSRSIYKGT